MSLLGKNIRLQREQRGLLLRQVAHPLGMDSPMLSKIERGERNAKREHLTILSGILGLPEDQLLTLWLADKVCAILKEQPNNLKMQAMQIVENELKS